MVAEVLSMRCTALVEISLRRTGLTCLGLPGLNPVFRGCKSLQFVFLQGNNLIAEDDDSIYAVLDFVEAVKTAKHLYSIHRFADTEEDDSCDMLHFFLLDLVHNDRHSLQVAE